MMDIAPKESGLSPAIQDYLRAIYKVSRRNPAGEPVTTTQLAARLGIKPASVTAMLQKLAATEPPLLEYQKHQGVALTPEGERAALSVVRHHRLLELYLHEKLGFSWDEVHEEADRLEHAISDLMAERMAAALGYPTHDPHGHAIPSADLELEASESVPLSSLSVGDTTAIHHVRDDDPAILRRLDEIGLRPRTQVRVLAERSDSGEIKLAVGAEELTRTLSGELVDQLFVNPPVSKPVDNE